MAVDTKHVKGRRRLCFATYQDILDDVHRLAASPCKQLGNWSLGQNCQHLAAAMDMAIDGPPFKAPWYIRLLGPLIKKRIFNKGMSSGFQLPKKATSLLPGCADTDAGVTALERSIERLQNAVVFQPHFVFGPLTREEWLRLNTRHAEMHLSFIVPSS